MENGKGIKEEGGGVGQYERRKKAKWEKEKKEESG